MRRERLRRVEVQMSRGLKYKRLNSVEIKESIEVE